MEDKLNAAYESANYMTVLASQKQILKEEYYQSLVYYYNGGVFTISQQFLTFVKLLLDLNQPSNSVLVDDNHTPVEISNLKEFFDNILSVYTEASNSYYTRFNNLKKARTVTKLLDL